MISLSLLYVLSFLPISLPELPKNLSIILIYFHAIPYYSLYFIASVIMLMILTIGVGTRGQEDHVPPDFITSP